LKKGRYCGTMQQMKSSGTVLLFLFLFGLCLYAEFSPTIRIQLRGVESFSPSTIAGFSTSSHRRSLMVLGANDNNDTNDGGSDNGSSLSNYKDSDGASKGIVGSLTGIVNKVSAARERDDPPIDTMSLSLSSLASDLAPETPEELLERIRKDYEERNYLWTGDLDLDCFYKDCVFTDPTISFVGTDNFTENTQNLVPIVEAFAEDYRSELLSISLGSGSKASENNKNGSDADGFYVETRWNMVGSLTASPWLFWKPKIDVIGRTKFWFRREDPSEGDESDSTSNGGGGYRVYFYDESWEIAAWKALLQIVTPAGTFPSTSAS
jgi:hypothetical protein